MATQTTTVLYILLLVAVIVAVDFLFFKHYFWERLAVNIGNRLDIRGPLLQIPETSMSFIVSGTRKSGWFVSLNAFVPSA
jgi:hypothetical protein